MFSNTFNNVLESCLERLATGETVEACLADHHHYAAKLRPYLQAAERYHSLPRRQPSIATELLIKRQLQHAPPVSHSPFLRYTRHINLQMENIMKIFIRVGLAAALAVIAILFMPRFFSTEVEPAAAPLIATATAVPTALERVDLANMTFQSDWAVNNEAILVDGIYQQSDDQVTIQLGELLANGDLDGDGWSDAAAILQTQVGSEAVSLTLTAVRNNAGNPHHIASHFYGEGMTVELLEIVAGTIQITLKLSDDTLLMQQYQLYQNLLVATSTEIEAARKAATNPTEITKLTPSIPITSYTGNCTDSNILPRAYRCFTDENIDAFDGANLFDPCYIGSDGASVVCGAEQTESEKAFVLLSAEPIAPRNDELTIAAPRIQLVDGTICSWQGGAGLPLDGEQRYNFDCANSTDTQRIGIRGNLLPGDVWVAERVTVEIMEGVGWSVIQSEWVSIQNVWQ